MNVVSNLVTSVTTPFHPFGGAVDIIVVKQQDGSFRSTPWYVRFGKFQGVLKGAEKIVKIEVNGVEANFYMHLDASGVASFIEEVVSDKRSDRLKDSDSIQGRKEIKFGDEQDGQKDSGGMDRLERKESVRFYDLDAQDEFEVRDERVALGIDHLERNESLKFYDFQDELDEVAELSDYDNLDNVEHVHNSQISSEVILVSVDGHVLTAPITSAEKKGEDVEIDTPRLHLGNTELKSREADGLSGLNSSSSGVALEDVYDKIKNQNVPENKSVGIKKNEVFKSCLQLSELASQEKDPSSDNHDIAEGKSLRSPKSINEAEDVCSKISGNGDVIECSSSDFPGSTQSDLDRNGSQSTLVDSNAHNEKPEEQIEVLPVAEGAQSGPQAILPERENTERENIEPQQTPSIEDTTDLAAEASDGNQIPLEANDAVPTEGEEMPKTKEDDSEISATPSGRRWSLWPNPFRRVKTIQHSDSMSSVDEVFVDFEPSSQYQPVEPPVTERVGGDSPHKQLVRTNVPTSDHIASLDLKEGQNMVTFIFSTRYLGVQKVDAHIYLWKYNARIVISDVDGTITKSDVLGQFMPLVGKDWTHTGIAHFFSAIKENGYQLLFLSARAIVQAYLTRSFLFNLKQDGKTLPAGPVVISPDGLFPSLYREVIRRAPHEFKIGCLEDIKALFPPEYNPFYAGFGNRDTDELSYRKIGIPKGKIFIINPKGEVAINRRIDVKSYTSLHTLVHDMFPPTSMVEQEDFNSWNFWKTPLPDIDDL